MLVRHRAKARAQGVLLALALFLLASAASAAPRVVLLRPPVEDEVLTEALSRLRAELTLQEFEVDVVDVPAEPMTPDGLSSVAHERGAFAGISLTRREGTAEAAICIADRATGKISMRNLSIGTGPDAPSVLAVRAAELLRSSLQEFESERRPPNDVVGVDVAEKPRFKTADPNQVEPRLRLGVRFAMLGLGQDFGPAYGPALTLSYRFSDRFWLGALAAGPALGSTYVAPSGSANLTQGLAVGRLVAVAFHSRHFELRPLVEAGVYHFAALGQVPAPATGQTDSVTSFAGGLGFELGVMFNRTVGLDLGLSGYLLGPRPGVAVLDDQRLFRWPFVVASLGLGLAF